MKDAVHNQSITLRSVGNGDAEFLFQVFSASYGDELELAGLPDTQREQLLRLQYQAKQDQYSVHYPSADFDVVCSDNEPVGYLYALRGPDDFVLVDIALLPECRGTGIGSQLVRELIDLAETANKTVQAHVLKHSPAWRLWQRLGFRQIADDGIFLRIETSLNTK